MGHTLLEASAMTGYVWGWVDAMRDRTLICDTVHWKSVWTPLGPVPVIDQKQTGRTQTARAVRVHGSCTASKWMQHLSKRPTICPGILTRPPEALDLEGLALWLHA